MDKHFQKQQNAVWRKKRTGKHFEKQTKVLLGKHKWTNISKSSILGTATNATISVTNSLHPPPLTTTKKEAKTVNGSVWTPIPHKNM